MILKAERRKVVEYGVRLVETGLVEGTFGNLSVCDSERKLMAISPSGMDYHGMTPEDVVVLDLEGNQVDGSRKPSSECDMHRLLYQKRQDVNAVVHTHSTFATTMACLNLSIPPVHYLVAYCGREVPCIPYVPFGTPELAEAACLGMGQNYACLLGNHGLLACGPTVAYAFDTAQQMEFLAEIYYRARLLGEPVLLEDDVLDGVIGSFQHYRKDV